MSDVFCTVESEREKRGQRRKDVGSLEPRRLLLPHVSERSPPAESPEGAVEVGTRERESERVAEGNAPLLASFRATVLPQW